MTTIIVALVFFSIIIMIHELGHFLVAKSVGIYAEEFSIGMGPRLLKISGKDTEYSLRALPIGGYVKFLGEDDASSDPRAFGNTKVWKRMAVIVAGPIMNFLLAILLLTIMFMSFGVYESDLPVIEDVIPGYAAQLAGLLPEDRIVEVDGVDLSSMSEADAVNRIRSLINDNGANPLEISVKRDNVIQKFTVTPTLDKQNNRYQLGFYFKAKTSKPNLFKAIGLSFVQTGRIIVMMIVMLKDLIFKGVGIGDVMGPVGIVSEIGRAAQAGIQQLLNLGIVITINLGIMNLIPFPALDGGRLTLLVVEALRGKPVDPKKEGYFHLVGFVLLMLLMIIVTYKDIIKI